jgi:hypothetical protein
MSDKLSVMKPKLFSDSESDTVAQFGSYKGNTASPVYSTDPDIIQNYTGATGRTGLTGQNAWTEGWNAAVDSNNCPTIQDMNAFFYTVMYQLCYIFQEGISHYMAAKEYHLNSFVKTAVTTNGSTGSTGAIGTGATGAVFLSVANDNIGNALSDETKWMPYYPSKVTTIGYNYTVAYDDYIIKWSLATTSFFQRKITLPTPSAANAGRELIIVVTSALGDILYVVETDPYVAGVNLKQYQSAKIKCTGTSWILVSRCYF